MNAPQANQSIAVLAARLKNDPQLVAAYKKNPIAAAEKDAQQPAYYGDKWIYRSVIAILGLIVLIAAGSYALIVFFGDGDSKVPESLIALGSTALGAIAGLLSPSPVNNQ